MKIIIGFILLAALGLTNLAVLWCIGTIVCDTRTEVATIEGRTNYLIWQVLQLQGPGRDAPDDTPPLPPWHQP